MTETLLYNAHIYTGANEINNGAILINDNKIKSIYPNCKNLPETQKNINVNAKKIIPGFIDSHIHGFGGFSLHKQSEDDILRMSEKLAAYGTTAFVATISRATSSKDELSGDIKAVVKAMGKEKGAAILGIHLEGPFLSLAKKGGQSESGITAVNLNMMEELWQTSEGKILTMTVAPELKNMQLLAEYCREKGIKFQAGHTNATYEQMQYAAKLGIKLTTHTFNAMTGLHHRTPGVVGAALENDDISCELIADGYHVHPAAVKILFKCKPEQNIILVTDAQKYTKTDIKSYFENGVEYELEGCFFRKEDKTLIGTNISIYDAFKNLIQWGIPLTKAISASSINAARYLNLQNRGELKAENYADFIVLNDDLSIDRIFFSGKEISKESNKKSSSELAENLEK